jgi:hypothetical protein
MEQVIEILRTLQQFYEQLPEQPPRPELSQLTRTRMRTLFLYLAVRSPELYNDLSQPIPPQLLTAFESLIISIHQKFHTQQVGSFIYPPE